MWKYNLEKHSVDEQPIYDINLPDYDTQNELLTDRLNRLRVIAIHKEYIAHLRSIPVSGKVKWIDGQELQQGVDFNLLLEPLAKAGSIALPIQEQPKEENQEELLNEIFEIILYGDDITCKNSPKTASRILTQFTITRR